VYIHSSTVTKILNLDLLVPGGYCCTMGTAITNNSNILAVNMHRLVDATVMRLHFCMDTMVLRYLLNNC
jgi:hypothetical protein